MTKKLFLLISALTTAIGNIGIALLNYFQPPMYGSWVSAISIIVVAITDVLVLFVVDKSSLKRLNEH